MQILSDHSGSITRLAELKSIRGPRGFKWGLLSKDMSPKLAISGKDCSFEEEKSVSRTHLCGRSCLTLVAFPNVLLT